MIGSFYRIKRHGFHPRIHLTIKIILLIRIFRNKILFKRREINFIPLLKLPIILMILLHSIISQMNKNILLILWNTIKLKTTRTNITLLVPIGLNLIVLNLDENYVPNTQASNNSECRTFSFGIKMAVRYISVLSKCVADMNSACRQLMSTTLSALQSTQTICELWSLALCLNSIQASQSITEILLDAFISIIQIVS